MERTRMDVNERIKDQLESSPVLLYMKGTPDFPQCGFSAQTVAALRAVSSEFAFVNIFKELIESASSVPEPDDSQE